MRFFQLNKRFRPQGYMQNENEQIGMFKFILHITTD